MTFSLRPTRKSRRPAMRGLGQDLRRLLEAGRRDERLGRERRLGDAEQQRLASRRLLALLAQDARSRGGSGTCPRPRRAGTRSRRSSLTCTLRIICDEDDLDVLVVDASRPATGRRSGSRGAGSAGRPPRRRCAGCRADRAGPRRAARPPSPRRRLWTRRCLPCGTRCSFSSMPASGATARPDDDRALAALLLAELDDAVDLRDDGGVLRACGPRRARSPAADRR